MAKGTKVLTEQEQHDADHFRDRLESLIKARGLTAAGLAKKAGIAPKTIYRILQYGADPTRVTLVSIARALDISIDALASDEPTQTPATSEAHIIFARNLLVLGFGLKAMSRLTEEERISLEQHCSKILQALNAPVGTATLACLQVLRAAINTWLYMAEDDSHTSALLMDRGYEQLDLPPLSRACLILGQVDWENARQQPKM